MLSEAIADDAVRNVPPVLLGKTTGMKRKSISKRLRFEIFKRDGFKCVHCGASPQSGPMHLDHLKPVAEGGDESTENLVTACVDCNLGKGPVPLELVKLRRGRATEAQREHAAQLREWLAIQRDVVQAKGEFEEMLEAEWEKRCGSLPRGIGTRLKSAVEEFGMERTMEAIEITSSAMWATSENRQVRYFHGVLKRFREGGVPQKRIEPADEPPAQADAGPRREYEQGMAADRDRVWADILGCVEFMKKNPVGFPSTESRRRHILKTFIVSSRIIFRVGPRTDNGWNREDNYAHGLWLKMSDESGSVNFSLGLDPDFDPQRAAYDDLRNVVTKMFFDCREAGRIPSPDLVEAYLACERIEGWLGSVTGEMGSDYYEYCVEGSAERVRELLGRDEE